MAILWWWARSNEEPQGNERTTYGVLDTYTTDGTRECLRVATPMASEPP